MDKVSINIYVRNSVTDNEFMKECAVYALDVNHSYKATKRAVEAFMDHLQNKEVDDDER